MRLPPGSDPADVVQRDGADAMRALLERAVPIARFEVERALERGDTADRRGPRPRARGGRRRDPAAAAERPARGARPARRRPAGADREPRGVARSPARHRCASRGRRAGDRRGGPNGARAALDRREQSERAFLAYCLALPEEGEERLAAADLDELFSAPATRRAAEYLRGRLRSPAGELPAGDEPLARLVAELVIRAGELEATPAKLELEALQLDLHNLDRRIATARTDGHERIHDLAAERQQVLDAIRHRLS